MARIKDSNRKVQSLPIIGKVKVGMKHPEKGYPMSIDYFRADGRFSPRFHKVLGEKPQSILIGFVSDDLDLVCNERYQIRDAQGKNFAQGDGETFRFWHKEKASYVVKKFDDEEQKQKFWEWAIKECSSQKIQAEWHQVLTLRFVIPEIPIAGMWQLETKGKASSIKSIVGTFDLVQEQAKSIIGVPFQLTVEKVKGDNPGKPKQYPVINITPVLDSRSVVTLGDLENRLTGGALRMLTAKDIKELAQPKALPAPENEVLEVEVMPPSN